MSVQMSFVFVKSTGHVMAVLTQTAGAELQAADVATPSLLVRGLLDGSNFVDAAFKLTADLLDVFTGDVVEPALMAPRTYTVDKEKKKVSGIGLSVASVTALSQKITVALPSPAGGPTNIFLACLTADPDKPEIVQSQLSGTGTSFDFSVGPLPSKARVLVLVAGYLPKLGQVP